MIAKEIISHEISPLTTSDTGEESITLMSLFQVKHLPIVNNMQLLGVISEEDILTHDMNEAIGSYQLSMAFPPAKESDHVFEIMSLMAKYKLTVVPVVDAKGNYVGLITGNDLMHYYAESFSFAEPGSILVIETTKTNYSLAEISRIVESENAAILGTFLTSQEDNNLVQVTLKINKQDISAIIASFERFDYAIKASFTELEYIDNLKERYDALMAYLNV